MAGKQKPQTRDFARDQLYVPPQNLAAERSVLGCLLLDNRCYDDVALVLQSGHFYADIHGELYAAVSEMVATGKPVDSVTLADHLQARGRLEEIGGVPYLLEILEAVPHSAHATHYAGIVRETWLARSLQSICQDSLRSILEVGGAAEELLEKHEQSLFALTDQRLTLNQEKPLREILGEALAALNDRMTHPERVPGLSLGFPELDSMTNGLAPTTLTILAARPSMGKTAFVCNIADWQMSTGKACVIFSLEQSRLELAERFVCIRSRLDSHRVRKGLLEPHERHALLDAAAELQAAPLWIDDTPGRTVAEMISICRRLKRKRGGLDVVIIDYLQLIEPEDRKAHRELQISTISRRLKGLAKELQVPVICLSQLNREVERREDKRPKLADLRESGAIEQDADLVMFLHRPEVYDVDDRPGQAELILAKHRSGKIGIVNLEWQAHSMRFQDPEPSNSYQTEQAALQFN